MWDPVRPGLVKGDCEDGTVQGGLVKGDCEEDCEEGPCGASASHVGHAAADAREEGQVCHDAASTSEEGQYLSEERV